MHGRFQGFALQIFKNILEVLTPRCSPTPPNQLTISKAKPRVQGDVVLTSHEVVVSLSEPVTISDILPFLIIMRAGQISFDKKTL